MNYIHKKIDLEMIQRLYEFGALQVWEVRVLDVTTFEIRTVMRTFSEEKAKENMDSLIKNKVKCELFNYFVKFDGAYSV